MIKSRLSVPYLPCTTIYIIKILPEDIFFKAKPCFRFIVLSLITNSTSGKNTKIIRIRRACFMLQVCIWNGFSSTTTPVVSTRSSQCPHDEAWTTETLLCPLLYTSLSSINQAIDGSARRTHVAYIEVHRTKTTSRWILKTSNELDNTFLATLNSSTKNWNGCTALWLRIIP